MTDLERTRDHCQRMATAEHTDDCAVLDWRGMFTHRPRPDCPGCVTDADRLLWRQLADEIDAHIDDDQPDLLDTQEDP